MLTRLFVISLPSAAARRLAFADRASTSLEWQFFDAYRELAAGLDYAPARALRKGGRHLTPTEIGCYSSHYSLWQQLLDDREADRYIIFEDDAVVDWGFFERLVADPEAAPWPLLRFQYSISTPTRNVTPLPNAWFSVVELLDYGFGAVAYQIRKAGAERLVPALAEVNIGIDMATEQGWRHGLRALSVFPFPVFHPVGDTQMDVERWDEAPKPVMIKFERGIRRVVELTRRTFWHMRRTQKT